MYATWYEEHYHEMSNAGLWFHSAGMNLIPATQWEHSSYRVLIARLSTARDTVDSFTHQLLYQTIAKESSIFVDCAWLPPPEDAELFDRWDIPWLTGIVTKYPACSFDCIAFSNSIVEELPNLALFLAKSGISLDRQERIQDQKQPLILLGGANAINTTILMHHSSPVDAVFIGEDTDQIQILFADCKKFKLQNKSKSEILEYLKTIEGVVVPNSSHSTVKKMAMLTKKQVLDSAPVFFGINEDNSGSLQISEGCPCLCTFCSESWNRKPYRELSFEESLQAARTMKTTMGIDKIDLYTFNFTMYERFKELLLQLYGSFNAVGVKSQRLDGVADDPDIVKIMHVAGKTSITVGIEGISSGIRRYLQKGLDEAKLRLGLKRLLEAPIRELKLFFIITGNEQSSDIDEYRELLVFITECMRSSQRMPRIIVSMTPLVRFPCTPLQHEAAPEPHLLSAIIRQCERLTMARRLEFRSAASMNDYLFSQITVRASDERVWDALYKASTATKFVYYTDFTDVFIERFLAELHEHGLETSRLLSGEGYVPLPVALPVDAGYMENVARISQQGEVVGQCLGTEYREGVCSGCGACPDELYVNKLTARRPRKNIKPEQLKTVIQQSRRNCMLTVRCEIDASYRGIPRNNIAAVIARGIMKYDEGTVDGFHGYCGSYIINRFDSAWIHGADLLSLAFHESLVPRIAAITGNRECIDYLDKVLTGICRISELLVNKEYPVNLKLRLNSQWPVSSTAYLAQCALKYTLHKDDAGKQSYLFTKDALRKKIVKSLAVQTNNGFSSIDVAPDEKFDYTSFVTTVIALPSGRHLYRIPAVAQFS